MGSEEILKGLQFKILKNELADLKNGIEIAVSELIEIHDLEEIIAIIIGCMEQSSSYIPAMERLLVLLIKRTYTKIHGGRNEFMDTEDPQ